MKKLFLVVCLGLGLNCQAVNLKSFSFLSPSVVSIMLTNNGSTAIGVTNLNIGTQSGGNWTNTPGSSQAVGLNMTNYANANNSTMYTQAVSSGTMTPGLYVGGTNIPGVLVVVVTTNLNNTSVGVMGVPPFSVTNLTYAKTNDSLNLFQDVLFPSDWSPAFGLPAGGPNTTNLTSNIALEVQLLGNQLTGTANASNYVALTFIPITSDGTQVNYWAPLNLPGTAAGSFNSLQPFTVNVTNMSSAVSVVNTAIIPIPSQYLFGASGLRLATALPGASWGTGGAMWLTRCRLLLITQ